MFYVTTRCPHCKAFLKILQPEGKTQYGSPLRTCPSCGGNYIDKSFVEISAQGMSGVDCLPFSPGWILSILIGALFVYGGIVDPGLAIIYIPLATILAGGGIYFIIREIMDRNKRDEFFEKEMRESKIRMSNPEYAKLLRDNDIF